MLLLMDLVVKVGHLGCIPCVAPPPLSLYGLGQLLALPGVETDLSLHVSLPRQWLPEGQSLCLTPVHILFPPVVQGCPLAPVTWLCS